MQATLRQLGVAAKFLIVMTILLGIIYPAIVFGVSRLVAGQADGAFVTDADGRVVGAANIGQEFSGPTWFHSRPSAADYDALASGGSNLAADNPELVAEVAKRQDRISLLDRTPVDAIPADAVTASASGLDPHISPEYAALQVERVARERGLSAADVNSLVAEHTEGRALGFMGEPRVNVLALNVALANRN